MLVFLRKSFVLFLAAALILDPSLGRASLRQDAPVRPPLSASFTAQALVTRLVSFFHPDNPDSTKELKLLRFAAGPSAAAGSLAAIERWVPLVLVAAGFLDRFAPVWRQPVQSLGLADGFWIAGLILSGVVGMVMVRKPVRVDETDMESVTEKIALEMIRLNREWDRINRLPEDAAARLDALRQVLRLPPWPADRPAPRRRAAEITREVDGMSKLFRTAYAKREDEELNRLNAQAQTLLDEKLSVEFARAQELIRERNITPVLAIMMGIVRTLDRKIIEYYWQRVRSYKTGKVRTLEAENWLGEVLETLELEGWDIREKALGSVTVPQQRWTTRVIQGVTVTRLQWKNIVYDSIAEAFRSQIHTMESQQEDFFDVVDRGVELRYVEKLLNNPSATVRGKALTHLYDVRAWARRGRVPGKKYAEAEIEQAIEAVVAFGAEKDLGERARLLARALERTGSARKVLREDRLKEIAKIRDFVEKRATALLEQIRQERDWSDRVRNLRDSLPETASRAAYKDWLDQLGSLLHATPYRKPPKGVMSARARLQPARKLLKSLAHRQDADLKGAQKSFRRIVRDLQKDLSFVGKGSETLPAAEVPPLRTERDKKSGGHVRLPELLGLAAGLLVLALLLHPATGAAVLSVLHAHGGKLLAGLWLAAGPAGPASRRFLTAA